MAYFADSELGVGPRLLTDEPVVPMEHFRVIADVAHAPPRPIAEHHRRLVLVNLLDRCAEELH